MSSPSAVAVGTRELTMAQAVNEALREELQRDPTVFIIGEDVAEAGTPFKVMAGLVEEFGPGVLRPDGELDRARLGEIAFRDPDARQRLDGLRVGVGAGRTERT